MLRLLSIPISLLVLVGLTLAWSGSRSPWDAEFTFVNRGDIITLDLNQMSYMQDFRVTYAMREGLYRPHPLTLVPEPAVAESSTVSDDKRIWTFHLRTNALWSNGEAVTAHDFVFSWRRLLEEPGEYTYLFYYVKNSKPYEDSYQENSPIDFKSVGIEALDDKTFRVTLSDPVPFLLDLIAFPPFYPRHERSMAEFREFLDRDLMRVVEEQLRRQEIELSKLTMAELWPHLERLAGDPAISAAHREQLADRLARRCLKYTFRSEYTRPPKVVTNGPFEFKHWEFKRSLYFQKSPNYWDNENVKIDSIEMVVNENMLSQFLQYEAGEVDWLSDVPVEMARDLRNRGRTDLRAHKAFGTCFMTLMVNENLPSSLGGGKNPLADVRVRQALAMAIDKAAITKDVTGMGEEVATTFVPPGTLLDYNPTPGLPYDPVRARQLLAEAGYPEGRGIGRLPILYNSGNPTRERVVQVLQEQWKRTLKLDFQLATVESKEYRNRITEKNYAIGIVAWYGDYPDVTTFTDKYLSTSLQNDCDWINPEYDALCAAAKKEADPAKRLAILNRAEYILNTQVPIIPLYHYVNAFMRRDYVQGLGENPRNVTVFSGISITPGEQ